MKKEKGQKEEEETVASNHRDYLEEQGLKERGLWGRGRGKEKGKQKEKEEEGNTKVPSWCEWRNWECLTQKQQVPTSRSQTWATVFVLHLKPYYPAAHVCRLEIFLKVWDTEIGMHLAMGQPNLVSLRSRQMIPLLQSHNLITSSKLNYKFPGPQDVQVILGWYSE